MPQQAETSELQSVRNFGRDIRGNGNIGQRIRAWRIARQMTQRALADLCDSPVGLISKWEHGHGVPSLRSLRALRQALGIGWEELLGD